MGNVNNTGRSNGSRPIVYNTYDVERLKAQSKPRQGSSPRPARQSYDPNRARNNSVKASNGSYSRRRPASSKKRKNNDSFLWILIILIGIMVVGAVMFLVNYLNDDVPAGPAETTEKTGASGPEETLGETTAPENEETTAPETVPETEAPVISNIPQFTADLTAYEMYMNPTGADRDAYLILVNPWNSLTASDVPSDLVNVYSTRKDGRATQKLREYAAKALEALMLEANACGVVKTNTPSGYPLSVMSAYRSYEYQNQLFNTYVSQEMTNKGLTREAAEAIVVTYSCRAGTSEHQTGLCVDMHTLSSAGQAFRYEAEALWLAENCHKFGFILRFPENKTDVTGITYEPWHFRYVGRYHATKIKDLGMCLEEYIEYLKTNS